MRFAPSAFLCSLLLAGTIGTAQPKRVDQIKEESSLTYHLSHPLHEIEATSKEVMYRLELDPERKEIKSVNARVDVTTFDSGNSNRDSHAMEVIDAISFPEATFIGTSISQNGDSVWVSGKITLHGVTRDIVIPVGAKWSPGRLEIHGAFGLSLTAFNIERPSLLMIPVDDTLKIIITAAYRWN